MAARLRHTCPSGMTFTLRCEGVGYQQTALKSIRLLTTGTRTVMSSLLTLGELRTTDIAQGNSFHMDNATQTVASEGEQDSCSNM